MAKRNIETQQQFWAMAEKAADNGCWRWLKTIDSFGYGSRGSSLMAKFLLDFWFATDATIAPALIQPTYSWAPIKTTLKTWPEREDGRTPLGQSFGHN
jgi:hypothetical protein